MNTENYTLSQWGNEFKYVEGNTKGNSDLQYTRYRNVECSKRKWGTHFCECPMLGGRFKPWLFVWWFPLTQCGGSCIDWLLCVREGMTPVVLESRFSSNSCWDKSCYSWCCIHFNPMTCTSFHIHVTPMTCMSFEALLVVVFHFHLQTMSNFSTK